MMESGERIASATHIDQVQNMIDYMEANLLEEITPLQIAKQCYMSVSMVNQLFKIVCEMSIMEYIRNRRLTLAGAELLVSNIHIIDLALKYGYETPEAFTKAFTRFHGFPPSFVRRAYPELKTFHPIKVQCKILGGWESSLPSQTKQNSSRQEQNLTYCYDETTKTKGGKPMRNQRYEYQIKVNDMQQPEDWNYLLLLTKSLNQAQIKFKVDGKTMIFAHGIEFKLEKICLTFLWNKVLDVKEFFSFEGSPIVSHQGFMYFDVLFKGRKVRCMFYGDCEGDDTEEFLYRNTDLVIVEGHMINVQSLEFYYENAEPDNEYYTRVGDWLKQLGQI